MESSVDTFTTSTTTFNYNVSISSTSPTSSPPPTPTPTPTPPVVVSPCAACKILRRRCVDKCVLAPYFPPTEPLKFTTAHRVFGASNIIKFLQELPESQRADAVRSMVYEAKARIRDPVYGCAGAICQLQKQVSELQAELARAQAELAHAQAQHGNLLAIICMEVAASSSSQPHEHLAAPPPTSGGSVESRPIYNDGFVETESFLLDHDSLYWEEPLWC